MACGCGKKKTTVSNDTVRSLKTRGATKEIITAEITSGDDFISVIYNGPSYPHYLPSPTGIISSYGILNYGIGKRGDVVRVHKDDYNKAKGRLYLPIEDNNMANKGTSGVRGPQFTSNSAFSTEADTNKRLNALKEIDEEPVELQISEPEPELITFRLSDEVVDEEAPQEQTDEEVEKPKVGRRKKVQPTENESE